MERSDDDEDSVSKEPSAGNMNDEDPEYVERDPTGRYGRYDDVLGKGAYKTVYRAFDDLEGIEVAWNQVNICNTLQSNGDMERLYSELHLLKMLKHENIMKFCNSWVDPRCQNVNFITEIFTSGTLRQYRQKHKHVNLRAIKHWSRQILRGLVYLHSHNPPIIHRDLKCDNIFINGNSGEVKIGDLGLAAILSQAPAAHSVIGTPEFMAPELYEEHYNELVDIYSFGMCLLELVTFEYPYSECTNAAQIYKKVTSGKKPEALKKVKDLETRKFVENCLASASERLHAEALLMDQFLQMDKDQGVVDPYQSVILDPHDDLRDLYPVPKASESQSEDAGKESEVVSEQASVARSSPILLENCGLDFQRRGLHRKRSRDFRIKVKKQDDKKVLVRFRITSSRGEVRYIQFDFELETDTAIGVASEMVAELDFVDQDPTIIAGIIDAELTALLPDWKPGSYFEEVKASNEFASKKQEPSVESSNVEGPRAEKLEISAFALGATDSLNETLVHGRFEVGFNLSGSHHINQEPDGMGCFSDFSSEHFEGGGSDLSLDASFDRLNAETSIHDMLAVRREEVITDSRQVELSTRDSSLSCFEGDSTTEKLEDDMDPEELRLLMFQQKQEIESLQFKHNQECLDLKTQLISKEAQTSTSSLLLEEQSAMETVNGARQSNTRNEGDFCGHADNEVSEVLPKIFGNKVESTSCKTKVIDDHGLLLVSGLSGRPELDEEGCLVKLQVMAGQGTLLSEGWDDAQGTIGGVILYTDKEAKVGKAASLTAEEIGGAPSGEDSRLPQTRRSFDGSRGLGLPICTQDQPSATKRQSYLEYYKAGSFQKEKVLSEKHRTVDGSLDPKDDEMEQLRKLQLKKSIADLEAKTLECLTQSSSYIAKSSVSKTPSSASLPSGRQQQV